jgi:hypothetical protein
MVLMLLRVWFGARLSSEEIFNFWCSLIWGKFLHPSLDDKRSADDSYLHPFQTLVKSIAFVITILCNIQSFIEFDFVITTQ